MKFFIASMLFSTAVLANVPACPELSGHFTVCKTLAGADVNISDIGFTQQMYEGVNVYDLQYTEIDDQGNYNVIEDQFIADGLTREFEDDSGMSAKIISKCANGILKVTEQLITDGQLAATVVMDFSKVKTQLKVAMSITAQGQTQKETLLCE